jgi:hypothetical protein
VSKAALDPVLAQARLAPALGFATKARAWEVAAEQWAKLFAFARERGLK